MTDGDTLAALADIELPTPPDWRPLIMLAAAILLLAVAAALLYIGRRKRQRSSSAKPLTPALSPVAGERENIAQHRFAREALARLERLQQEWSSGAIDARAAAYRLGTLLRIGLNLPQLHPAVPPVGLDTKEWRETLTLLQGLRYTPTPAQGQIQGQALTHETFTRMQRWLSQDEPRDEARDV